MRSASFAGIRRHGYTFRTFVRVEISPKFMLAFRITISCKPINPRKSFGNPKTEQSTLACRHHNITRVGMITHFSLLTSSQGWPERLSMACAMSHGWCCSYFRRSDALVCSVWCRAAMDIGQRQPLQERGGTTSTEGTQGRASFHHGELPVVERHYRVRMQTSHTCFPVVLPPVPI
jgi:hypothetical protein